MTRNVVLPQGSGSSGESPDKAYLLTIDLGTATKFIPYEIISIATFP